MANLFGGPITTPIGTARIIDTESHDDYVTVHIALDEFRLTPEQLRAIGDTIDTLRAYIRSLEARLAESHELINAEIDLPEGPLDTADLLRQWRDEDGVTELLREETD